jgi:hypothetical protein
MTMSNDFTAAVPVLVSLSDRELEFKAEVRPGSPHLPSASPAQSADMKLHGRSSFRSRLRINESGPD